MSAIQYLLANRIAESLSTEMMTNLSQSDPTRAKVVKPYRFQQSPIEDYIYLSVSPGDPDDPNVMDGRISLTEMENLKMNIPTGEIGGGHYWWRRGIVKIGAYFVTKGYDQDTAAGYAQIVRGRTEHYTERVNVTDLVDEFDERAYYLMVISSTFTEGGGPENQYLWRGKVVWQALTHRVY